MKSKLFTSALLSSTLFFAGCASSKRVISCMNESAETQWDDGTTQTISSNLGSERFTWLKDEAVVEVSVLQQGTETKIKVPARQNGTQLLFSSGSITYIIDTSNGKLLSTATGESPDGNFVIKTKGECSGFN